ncbi:MAG TPA: SsgA family sporulation/cell division regulator [Mycobacteriales bacterium]|jgi:hypothetical protein|nr:SsgA family sporulation/cell division regulator [Mycobacteriales bacterium]
MRDSEPVPAGAVVVDAVSGAVRLDLIVAGAESGRGRRIMLRMQWEPADPLGVALFVSASPDHPALPRGQWVVLRDFLRYGMDEATGDGDVRVRPDRPDPTNPASAREPLIWLELARSGRPCCVGVPVGLLARFLDETEKVIPVGEERSEALVDEFINRLLNST